MIFTGTSIFKKQYKKLNKDLVAKIAERLKFFETDEFSPILNNHKLAHDYEGFRSINITGDWRIIYRKEGNDIVLLHRVGTHHQLFGK